MKTTLNNFIPLNRKLFKHEFWLQKRAYSRFEAWLDLISSARFDDTEARKLVGCSIVRWQRGELVASIRFLGERWGWTKSKVETFIKLLKHEKMITTRTAEGTIQTIITICNYADYNQTGKPAMPETRQPADNGQTTDRQPSDETNKENNDKNSKQNNTYRAFAHLSLYHDDFIKLTNLGFKKNEIDKILDEIENYKNNKKYTSLFLTAKAWLQKEQVAARRPATAAGTNKSANGTPPGKITGIANAFQQALRH